MSLRPSPLAPVPAETVRVVQAAFPKGHPYLKLRDTTRHWRIYQVLDPKPLVASLDVGEAQTMWVGRQGFALDVGSVGGAALIDAHHVLVAAVREFEGAVVQRFQSPLPSR